MLFRSLSATFLLVLLMAPLSYAKDIRDYFPEQRVQQYEYLKSKAGEDTAFIMVLKSGRLVSRDGRSYIRSEHLLYREGELAGKTVHFNVLDSDRFLLEKIETYSPYSLEVMSSQVAEPALPLFLTFPPEDGKLRFRSTMRDSILGGSMEAEIVLSISRERIDTAAGSFDCIRTDREMIVSGRQAYTETSWRARGVGLVKAIKKGNGLTYTITYNKNLKVKTGKQ